MKKLKLIAPYVRLITCLLLRRNFGKLKTIVGYYKTLRANAISLFKIKIETVYCNMLNSVLMIW